jgi:glycine/D-amino acid oxidase-like deaminating enzyme
MLEKEAALAAHQTGHNSGVIHAGVYYAPGSLKAALCKAGATATYAFAAAHGLPTVRCGKLIVATDDVEVARLKDLFDRCRLNGLEPEMLDSAELARIEPHIAGRAAIRVASSGIADYPAITRTMAEIATAGGARILTGHPVLGLSDAGDAVVAETPQGRFRARHAIVCAGLMADRLARMCGVDLDFRIVPFRGEYYRLPASKARVALSRGSPHSHDRRRRHRRTQRGAGAGARGISPARYQPARRRRDGVVPWFLETNRPERPIGSGGIQELAMAAGLSSSLPEILSRTHPGRSRSPPGRRAGPGSHGRRDHGA